MARGVKRLLKILLVLILLGAIAYVSIVLMVCWKETHVAAPGKDYEAMLVLGAQVKPDGTPSLQLQWRKRRRKRTARRKCRLLSAAGRAAMNPRRKLSSCAMC